MENFRIDGENWPIDGNRQWKLLNRRRRLLNRREKLLADRKRGNSYTDKHLRVDKVWGKMFGRREKPSKTCRQLVTKTILWHCSFNAPYWTQILIKISPSFRILTLFSALKYIPDPVLFWSQVYVWHLKFIIIIILYTRSSSSLYCCSLIHC